MGVIILGTSISIQALIIMGSLALGFLILLLVTIGFSARTRGRREASYYSPQDEKLNKEL